MVVRLKRNLHCFKRGFYGEFIPDSSVPHGGGGYLGCSCVASVTETAPDEGGGEDADGQFCRGDDGARDEVGEQQQRRAKEERDGQDVAVVAAGEAAHDVRHDEADEGDAAGEGDAAADQQGDEEDLAFFARSMLKPRCQAALSPSMSAFRTRASRCIHGRLMALMAARMASFSQSILLSVPMPQKVRLRSWLSSAM